jgi:hypothetical protein
MADMVLTLVDGGITISKLLHDTHVLPSQVLAYRDFVRLVFLPDR